MSLSDFATFSTAISGLAVTASLIYLALQTHQNAKHTKALILEARTERSISQLVGFSDADKAAAWIVENGGQPTQEAIRQRQFFMHCTAIMMNMRDTFAQHDEGLLSDEQFALHNVDARLFLSQSAFRAYWNDWRALRHSQAPKCIAYMDGLMSDIVAH